LAAIEKIQTEALDRLALNAAQTTAQRGDVALTRLRYIEAAQHFAKAARLLPQTDDFSEQKSKYLDDEASALYRQGDEFGDNAALVSAIDRSRLSTNLPALREGAVPVMFAVLDARSMTCG
jgi:hypothetical protein